MTTEQRLADLLGDARHTLDHFDRLRDDPTPRDWRSVRRDIKHLRADVQRLAAHLEGAPRP